MSVHLPLMEKDKCKRRFCRSPEDYSCHNRFENLREREREKKRDLRSVLQTKYFFSDVNDFVNIA